MNWIKRLLDRLKAWFGRQVDAPADKPVEDDPPVAVPVPVPVPTVPDADGHVVRRISHWFAGVNMGGASLDADYRLTVSRDGRVWSDAPPSWRSGKAGPGGGSDATAMCCAAYQDAAGNWIGGKYEWHVRPPRNRSWHNIAARYGGWQAPPVGTEVVLWAYTADGNRVSTEARAVYQ